MTNWKGCFTAVVCAGLLVSAAHAERTPGRFLTAVNVSARGSGERARIRFEERVRYIRHTLANNRREVIIEFEPVVAPLAAADIQRQRNVIHPAAPAESIIEQVIFDGGPPATLEVRFSARSEVIVRPGSDGRTIDVFFRGDRPSRPVAITPRPQSAQPEQPAGAGPVAELVQRSRDHLTAGEVEPALASLQSALALPEAPETQEALELLGVARERNGQLAHAKAEYQAYLARYPDSEGATRVEQRLRTLLSARSTPRSGQTADTEASKSSFELDGFGSLALIYRRDTRETDFTGDILTNDTALSDLFFGWRGRSDRWDVRGEFSGSYEYSLLAQQTNEARVRALSFEAAPADGHWFLEAGRQTANNLGAIGRFDGIRYGYAINDSLGLRMIAGTSVDLFTSSTPSINKPLLGVGAEFSALEERLNGEVFVVHQRAHDLSDRSAVGGGIRYIDDHWFGSVFVDYDFDFGSVNTISAIGNWRVVEGTTLNVFVDHRNAPILTTSNALIGQTSQDLDALRDRFGESELGQLAEDRTGTSTQATLGLTQQLSSGLQIAGDFTISQFSSTEDSAGVAATEGTGSEPSYFLQLIGSDVLVEGDTMVVGLRHFDGRLLRTSSLLTSWRVAVSRSLRIQPRINVSYREPTLGESYMQVRPILRMDWRWRSFTFDLEANGEWIEERAIDSGDETGWGVAAGIRMDF